MRGRSAGAASYAVAFSPMDTTSGQRPALTPMDEIRTPAGTRIGSGVALAFVEK